MFDPVLNLSASTYEIIIAAFLVVGLLQVGALWRKAKQAQTYREAVIAIGVAASVALDTAKNSIDEAVAEMEQAVDEMEDWRQQAMRTAAAHALMRMHVENDEALMRMHVGDADDDEACSTQQPPKQPSNRRSAQFTFPG